MEKCIPKVFEEEGNIRVGDVIVHNIPEMKEGDFVQIERYNFEGFETGIIQ